MQRNPNWPNYRLIKLPEGKDCQARKATVTQSQRKEVREDMVNTVKFRNLISACKDKLMQVVVFHIVEEPLASNTNRASIKDRTLQEALASSAPSERHLRVYLACISSRLVNIKVRLSSQVHSISRVISTNKEPNLLFQRPRGEPS